MITIKEIAALAKVSVSTVSKAINHRPDVNETTRQKILALVAAHHFRPNAFGKGLQSQTTESIGVIFYRETQPLSGNPFYSRVLEGIEAELAINNYNLVLNLIPEQHQGTLPKMVQERDLKIPEDLSLIGFDDIELARLASPPLTTVRVYKEELGSIAVRSLLRIIQAEKISPLSTIVPVRLVERESVRTLSSTAA